MATEISSALPMLTDKSFSETIDNPFRHSSDNLHSPVNSSPPDSSHGQPYSSDVAREGEISVLDPRRFTPTLHASLVSEILSVRRDLDLKAKFIDGLETNLQVVKSENEALFGQLSRSSKENRTIKRQLEHLERDSSAALEGLAKERDTAKESDNGMKYKIEMLRRKIRAQEEDAAQWQEALDKEKSTWDLERRRLERRVHTSETRLKVVLKDVATYRASDAVNEAGWARDEDDMFKNPTCGIGSDSNSIRSLSRRDSPRKPQKHVRNQSNGSGRKSIRLSAASFSEPDGMTWLNGQSLADELSFDEEDMYSQDAIDSNDDLTEQELRARRGMDSSQSYYQDEKAKRVLGLTPTRANPISSRMDLEDPLLEQDEVSLNENVTKQRLRSSTKSSSAISEEAYKDSGIQFSPVSSSQSLNPAILENNGEIKLASETSHNAHQKQAPTASSASESHEITNTGSTTVLTVSSGCQTVDLPISPPTTPQKREGPKVSLDSGVALQCVSTSTQTEFVENNQRPREPTKAVTPLPIPTITINPPLSAPSSPKDAILPPGTKNASCQIKFDTEIPMSSASVQTEEIRIDQRSIRLLSKHIPFADTFKSSISETEQSLQLSVPNGPAAKTASLILLGDGKSCPDTNEAPRPANFIENHGSHYRKMNAGDGNGRPESSELVDSESVLAACILAGNVGTSLSERYEDPSEAKENQLPKDTTSHAASTSISPIFSCANAKLPRSIPEAKVSASPNTPGSSNSPVLKNITNLPLRSPHSFDKSIKVEKRFRHPDIKQKSVWRSTLIQSGTMAHRNNHSKSPSIGSGGSSTAGNHGANPPFPVPARSSSMGITHCDSDVPQSPTPRKHGSPAMHHQLGRRHASRANNIRKVRSAAAISRDKRPRYPQSQLPPQSPTRAFTETPQSLAAASKRTTSPVLLQSDMPNSRLHHFDTTSQGSGTYTEGPTQPSVIEAIAATMVGEWMWKYVRKRKSFGIVENGQENARVRDDGSGNITGNGMRHKRWVWLSPYDKTVMWSSKQPTTEAALMGKPSRTLNIQSVLDVKDDTPILRNTTSQAIYNRSILILTPERALKFTAFSADRHYLWLKALSFLVHSSTDQPVIPPVPTSSWHDSENTAQQYGPSLRRASVKDSFQFGKESAQTDLGAQNKDSGASIYLAGGFDEHVSDAASPPNVPRFYHGRIRSNTGSRLSRPSISSRAFPPTQPMISAQSTSHSDGFSTVPQKGSAPNGNDTIADISRRMSVTKVSTQADSSTEVMPTYRMEAFFEPRLSGESFQGLPGLDQLGNNNYKNGSSIDQTQNGFLFESAPEIVSLFRGF